MKIDLTLPMPAIQLIPHRPPMLLVDRLLSTESGSGRVEACLEKDSLLVDSNWVVEEVALVEMLAQSYATIKGYEDLVDEKPIREGFLVGMRKLSVMGRAFAGDRLVIDIRTTGTFEGFAVVEGEIRRADELIASGFIKLWLDNEDAKAGEEA